MVIIYNANNKSSFKKIEEFEEKYNINLPIQYREFLLKYNGGNVNPNVFKISDEEGETAVNILYGLGIAEKYDELSNVFDSLYGEICAEFIPIGDDSGGNQICLGIKDQYLGKIYLFLHDVEEIEEMSSMVFISNSFSDFLECLYE